MEPSLFKAAVALLTAGFGVIATAVGAVGTLAQSAPVDSLAPWVSGGGAAAAVGGLVYVAKKFADGTLVALPVAQLLEQGKQDKETLLRLLAEANEREADHRALLIAKGGVLRDDR